MSSSDEDYVADDSDDDRNAQRVPGTHGTRSSGPVKDNAGGRGPRGGEGKEKGKKVAAWENINRSWDVVIEGADGSINSTVEGINQQNKRKRYGSYLTIKKNMLTI
jgi:transcription initiation factor TFIIH subunit 2